MRDPLTCLCADPSLQSGCGADAPVGLLPAMGFDFQAAYDQLNASDEDYRFYAARADGLHAGRVVNIGCGTGVLATLLAHTGRHVVGIDPDPGGGLGVEVSRVRWTHTPVRPVVGARRPATVGGSPIIGSEQPVVFEHAGGRHPECQWHLRHRVRRVT